MKQRRQLLEERLKKTKAQGFLVLTGILVAFMLVAIAAILQAPLIEFIEIGINGLPILHQVFIKKVLVDVSAFHALCNLFRRRLHNFHFGNLKGHG